MKRSSTLSIILISVGVLCFIIFHSVGSFVQSDGLLVEPFALLPIGWLFLLAGVISGAVSLFANYTKTTVLGLAAGLIGGILGAMFMQSVQPSNESRIHDFYATENAVHVSPHGLRKKIMEQKNDAILVDLRSAQEYEKEHIVGAVNIPAYKDPDHSAYDEVDRIVSSFRALPKDKPVIVYCYSMPCMTGRKIGQMLAEHGIYVQHLGIGWNEWRYFWNLWNHEGEWDKTNVEDYVTSGTEPGSFKGEIVISPCFEGEFGC